MIDLEKIKLVYNLGSTLGFEDIEMLLRSGLRRSYAPAEYVIREGSVQRDIFFIRKGLIRSFLLTEKGDEITVGLRREYQIFASADIILFNQPSRFYVQAIEETEVYRLDYDELQRIISKNVHLEQNRKQVLLQIIREANQRLESFLLCSPEERYVKFVKDNQDLVNRVPDKYIANLLGVTAVSLSRIRKRIAQKKQVS
jgi:CRP-like cAMP-binding protein